MAAVSARCREVDDWFSAGGPRVPRFWTPFLTICAAILVLILLWGVLR